jgi:heme exporter protein A
VQDHRDVQLKVEDLCVERGQRLIVDRLSFIVAAGEGLLLLGRNGAGKTTLLRAIAGFLAPSAGRIALEATPAESSNEGSSLGERCHYVGHANAIKHRLTCIENLAFWARFGHAEAEPPGLLAILDRVGLGGLADIPAGYLSAGQKRRLCLARLLTAGRPLWLLDEPTVSLDDAGHGVLVGMVDRHLATGGLVVAATHLPLAFAHSRQLRLGDVA